MSARERLFELQQLLIDALPTRYDVRVLTYKSTFKLAVTPLLPPTREVHIDLDSDVFDGQAIPAEFIKKICDEIELRRVMDLLAVMKFAKQKGVKYYQRPGSEVKVWIIGNRYYTADMYGRNRIESTTCDELLTALASGNYR